MIEKLRSATRRDARRAKTIKNDRKRLKIDRKQPKMIENEGAPRDATRDADQGLMLKESHQKYNTLLDTCELTPSSVLASLGGQE